MASREAARGGLSPGLQHRTHLFSGTPAKGRLLKRMGQICEDPLGLGKNTHGAPMMK